MPALGSYQGTTLSSFGQSPQEVQAGQNESSWRQSILAQALQGQQGDYALKQQKMANQGNLAQAQAAAEASKYGSNTQLQAIQAQLAQSQNRFNSIFPYFQGAYGQISGAAGGGMSSGAPYGGMSPGVGGGGGGAVGNYGYGTAQAPQYGQGGEESNMNLLQIGSGYGPGPGVGTPAENAAIKSGNDAIRAANAKAGVFDSSPRLPGDTENKGVMYQGYPYGTTPPATGVGTAQGSSGGGGGGGYQSALPPAISPGQLQANINLNNAQNWSQAGGESRRQTQQVAGSGLGATSPLARALQAQTFGGALAANTAGATTARQGAAELNAKQLLGAYQADQAAQASRYGSQVGAQASMYGSQTAANASQYNARLNYQAALAQVQAQRQNSLLAALSNFAGSV